jgi:hypothetical protein
MKLLPGPSAIVDFSAWATETYLKSVAMPMQGAARSTSELTAALCGLRLHEIFKE